MSGRDYSRILRRSWWWIAISTVLGVVAAWFVTAAMTPVYAATSAAFVSTNTPGTLNDLTQGTAFTERRVNTYANLVTEPIVTQPVIDQFALGVTPAEFAEQVSVSIPVDSTLLEVTVEDASPAVAASVANALITSLTTIVGQVETSTVVPQADPAAPPVAAPSVKITQVRFAEVDDTPVNPILLLNLVVGLLVGLALGVLAAIIRDLVDSRVRSVDDVEYVVTNPVVGAIPQLPRNRTSAIVAEASAGSPSAEAFRILRTNLQFLDVGGPSTFVITSPGSGAGKSTLATNLAVAIAANGTRVLVVDADLRRPQVHEYYGIEGGAGLTDVLIGRVDPADVIQAWGSPNLHVLTAGRIPPNPSELLGSPRMRSLMADLESQYDVVLYDTPPVLPVPDAAILSRSVGGVLVVASLDRTRREELRRTVASLEKVTARISGIVVNRVSRRGPSAYLTEAYHSVGNDGDSGHAPRSQGRGSEPRPADQESEPAGTAPAAGHGTATTDEPARGASAGASGEEAWVGYRGGWSGELTGEHRGR